MMDGYDHKSQVGQGLMALLLGRPQWSGRAWSWGQPALHGDLNERLITCKYFQHIRMGLK